MIGESAVVTRPIKAASIIVAGKVNGDITASQRIELRFSA
jgi:cytoskeletal protein CcmA (bactofilin family)